jgi:hypothetical protein
MSEQKTGKQISDFDQLCSGIEDLSRTVAEYRKELIENGIPEKLADDIAQDFSREFWINIFRKSK